VVRGLAGSDEVGAAGECDTFADAGSYHSEAVVEFLREECVEILAAKAEVGT
jgi:hypothetical protein